MEYLGNEELLNKQKTAFLCSRQIDSTAVMRCYDWATEQKGKDVCIISGFHSPIEKDVLHFLLKCHVPVIMVLGRKMYKNLPENLSQSLAENRLLIISTANTPRQSKETALARNQYILSQANSIVLGSLNPNGGLRHLIENEQVLGKLIILSESHNKQIEL